VIDQLHGWLSAHNTFSPISLVLYNQLLQHLDNPEWISALKYYVFSEVYKREDEVEALLRNRTSARGKQAVALYRTLINEPAFKDAVVKGKKIEDYEKLAEEFGEKVKEMDLDFLQRQIQWEVSKLYLILPLAEPFDPPKQTGEDRPGISWKEVAERLKSLRAQGTPWTSFEKLADQIGCVASTVYKAIQKTPELQSWAKSDTASAPRAQSLTPPMKKEKGYVDMVADRTADSRQLDPADEVEIREYLEREDLTPEERAFFNGLPSREDQLFFLHDPDKHQKVLGRKP